MKEEEKVQYGGQNETLSGERVAASSFCAGVEDTRTLLDPTTTRQGATTVLAGWGEKGELDMNHVYGHWRQKK